MRELEPRRKPASEWTPALRDVESGGWDEPPPGFDLQPSRPRWDIWNPPVFGVSAVLLGVAALFRAHLLLGPIAVLFGVVALIRRQYALGAIGIITGASAVLTSPWLWTGIGFAWLYERFF